MKLTEKYAGERSLVKRKPLYGVGINDADYVTRPTIKGKRVGCPYYVTWAHMMCRCYSDNYQDKRPTYKGCSVVDEWLLFSCFKKWMIKQDWKGKELDKDVVSQGNKIYSPETCLFVTREVNTLLNECNATRGVLPQGVSIKRSSGKYQAQLSVDGVNTHIGYYDTDTEAYDAYKIEKYKAIRELAAIQSEPLKGYLLRYKIK